MKESGMYTILTNMLGDAALIVSSEEDGPKKAGERVMVIKLDRL